MQGESSIRLHRRSFAPSRDDRQEHIA